MKPQDTVPSPTALISRPFQTLDLDTERVICLDLASRKSHILYRDQHALLLALQRPCPLAELSQRLEDIGWSDHAIDRAPDLIAPLIKQNLITRLGAFLDEVDAPPPATPPAIDCITWPTRNRPESLKKALSGWIDYLSMGTLGQPELVIADDSDEGSPFESQTRAVVEAAARTYPGTVRYLGWQYRRLLAQELDADGGSSGAFALGLLPSAFSVEGRYGAARNLLLLACAGKVILMSDDDTLPQFKVHPQTEAGIELSPADASAIIHAFARKEDLEAYGRPASPEELRGAYSLLGQSFPQAMASHSTDLSRCESQVIRSFTQGCKQIAGLVFGAWGDSGMGPPLYLLAENRIPGLDPTLEDYALAKESRLVFRSHQRHSLGQQSMMGMHIVLDLRSVLPPFNPFGRNEDGLWARLVPLINPGHFLAHPAIAIEHSPPEPRKGSLLGASNTVIGLNDALAVLLQRALGGHIAPDSRYHLAGTSLEALKNLDHSMLEDLFSSHACALQVDSLKRLAQTKALHRLQEEDITTVINSIEEQITQGLVWAHPGYGPGLVHLRTHAADYGRLLKKWPSLFGKATALARSREQ